MKTNIYKVIAIWLLGLLAYFFLTAIIQVLAFFLFGSLLSEQIGGIGLERGFFIFLGAHFIFSILYVRKDTLLYRNILIGLFIVYNILLLIPWRTCSTISKGGEISTCDCLGDIKGGLSVFESQCVGIRTHCYTRYDDKSHTLSKDSIEIECQ